MENMENIDNWEKFTEWAKRNKVKPQQAQDAVQIFCINTRDASAWPCFKCNADLNVVGLDNIDNGYYCKKCKTLIQVG